MLAALAISISFLYSLGEVRPTKISGGPPQQAERMKCVFPLSLTVLGKLTSSLVKPGFHCISIWRIPKVQFERSCTRSPSSTRNVGRVEIGLTQVPRPPQLTGDRS